MSIEQLKFDMATDEAVEAIADFYAAYEVFCCWWIVEVLMKNRS